LLSFPSGGHLLINSVPNASNGNKYLNAQKAYSYITTTNNLLSTFLSSIGVTYTALGASGTCDPGTSPPPVSINTTHNYIDGSINYTAVYDTKTACRGINKTYQNISISVEDPIPTITEFVIPGRSAGPLVQRLNVDSPKKITITVEGALSTGTIVSNSLPDCCSTLAALAAAGCNSSISSVISGSLTGVLPASLSNHKLTQNQFVYSVDGSYSMTKSYIICSGT